MYTSKEVERAQRRLQIQMPYAAEELREAQLNERLSRSGYGYGGDGTHCFQGCGARAKRELKAYYNHAEKIFSFLTTVPAAYTINNWIANETQGEKWNIAVDILPTYLAFFASLPLSVKVLHKGCQKIANMCNDADSQNSVSWFSKASSWCVENAYYVASAAGTLPFAYGISRFESYFSGSDYIQDQLGDDAYFSLAIASSCVHAPFLVAAVSNSFYNYCCNPDTAIEETSAERQNENDRLHNLA